MSELEKPEEVPSDKDQNDNAETNTTEPVELSKAEKEAAELVALKQRADLINLKYHPNIGLEKLRARVNEQLSKDADQLKAERKAASEAVDELPDAPQTKTFDRTVKTSVKHETPAERKMRIRKKASRLIRIRMTCMNPAKKAWPGEMFTVSNSSAGTFKKYVPFNIDNGWHIPEILLGMLQERKFAEHYIAGKDARGREIKRYRLVKEFAIEILPPLTAEQLKELKTQQAMAGTIGKD